MIINQNYLDKKLHKKENMGDDRSLVRHAFEDDNSVNRYKDDIYLMV